MTKLTIDFETRSQASLADVGAWAYSIHPSTDVLCVGWSGRGQWRMGEKQPHALFKSIKNADVVMAHNAQFEIYIWQNVCHARYKWPAVLFEKWRCTAAKAAAHSLPRHLGEAGRAFGLDVVKDEMYGKWAMQKLSRPRKPTKNDASAWNDDEKDWKLMLEYNHTDVESEEALSAATQDLSAQELAVWRLTEHMNMRGFPIDIAGVKKAIQLAGEHAKHLTGEFQKLTGLESARQRTKFLVWLNQNGVAVADTTAGTLDTEINKMKRGQAGNSKVCRTMTIVREIGRSSIAKYRVMLERACSGRVRGAFLYCGAAATGRWAASGVQPHNFPRDAVIPDQNVAWRAIHELDLSGFALLADPLEALSGALRGAICAPPGREFLCGDKAQIEARVTFWLSGEKNGLDLFRRGEDVYCDAASTIFNKKITKADKAERFLGKQATLALGFGAGFVKYLVHCRALGAPRFSREQVCALVPAGQRESLWAWISTDGLKMVKRLIPDPTREDLMELVLTKYIVDKWRARYKDTVVALWRKLEECAANAVDMPGVVFEPNNYLAYFRQGRFLKLRLPSGRCLHYTDPEIGDDGITYTRVDKRNQWSREKTYGGKLLENAVQATARDILAEAMLRLEATPPYHELVLTVHDEVVCEIDEGVGDLDEFLRLMSVAPKWAPRLPIAVEGWRGKRYRK